MPKPTMISFEIETCQDCPYVRSTYTIGAGMAHDYHCGFELGLRSGCSEEKTRKLPKVMGYVEGRADYKPVPDWCALRTENALPYSMKWNEAHNHIADLRNKYGQLHAYWQFVEMMREKPHLFEALKDEMPTIERLIELNERFVYLLKKDI